MRARRRFICSLFLLPISVCLVGFTGCKSCDLVEAELRTRENAMYDMRAEMSQLEAQNEALLRELQAVRQSPSGRITPEQASQLYTLKQITLGRGTGGYDNDDLPGDEALQVVIEPRDGDGHTIKVPGSVHVDAFEISQEGIKTL